MDGEPGYEDVVFNDCSILIADSLPGYEAQCTTFVIIALIPVFVSFMFLKTIDSNKKKSDKQKLWYLPGVKGKLNLVERLIRINIVVGIAHALRCIDFCGYSGILDLSTSHTFFTGICVAGPMHTIFLLATSWVTIVDGGKSKKTPKWAKICFEVAKYSIYISEIFLGLAEMNTPAVADYAGAQDGRPSVIKYLFAAFWCLVYFVICFVYGRKIAQQLSMGTKEKSKENKKIERILKLTTFCLFFGFLLKFWGPFGRQKTLPSGHTWINQQTIPCGVLPIGGGAVIIPFTIFVMQYAIMMSTEPSKKASRLVNGVSRGFTSMLGSTFKSKKKTGVSGSSGKSSGKSGSTGTSSGSDTSSDTSDTSDVSSVDMTSSVAMSSASIAPESVLEEAA
ncbi:hypothetical protein ScalyP_jg11159 [Parmales sp. scaly parma]|nr:hypothetical protein ScalyP_jg11159 [Parmales sp. scaly parma]